MGKRRLKQCKACRRKFTPKNQKPIELEESVSGTNPKTDETIEQEIQPVPSETEESEDAKIKSTDDSKPLLNALDKEWTS